MAERRERRTPALVVQESHIESEASGIVCVVTFVHKQKPITFRFEIESWTKGNLRLRRNDGGKLIDSAELAGLVRDYAKQQILQYVEGKFSK